jgi:DNA-binding transcriptional ArsR family regulator
VWHTPDVPESPPLDDLRALAHPVRMRILSLLTGTAMSASEIAREFGESQANISYHLRRLHTAGLLHVAEEVRIRGGRAKRYRHDPESGHKVTSRDPEEARVLMTAVIEELRRRSAFRDPDRPSSLSDAELWVDPILWAQVVGQARELSHLLHAAAEPPRTAGTVRVSATLALFEMK